MLPKARRLTSAEVREVLKSGRSKRAEYLSMKYIAQPTALRASVVVSKAVAKGAVERNRLRRALYHALSPIVGSGTAVIFVQKKPKKPLQPAFAEDLQMLFPA